MSGQTCLNKQNVLQLLITCLTDINNCFEIHRHVKSTKIISQRFGDLMANIIKEWINSIIIHSKYFLVSDWLKPHAQVTTTSCYTPNLEIFVIFNRWRQKCSPLQINEPMTSKWRQKCSPLQIIAPLTKKTWGGAGLCYFWWAEKQRAHSFLYEFENTLNKKNTLFDPWNSSLISYSVSFNNC